MLCASVQPVCLLIAPQGYESNVRKPKKKIYLNHAVAQLCYSISNSKMLDQSLFSIKEGISHTHTARVYRLINSYFSCRRSRTSEATAAGRRNAASYYNTIPKSHPYV
jgi:hypothetical protein